MQNRKTLTYDLRYYYCEIASPFPAEYTSAKFVDFGQIWTYTLQNKKHRRVLKDMLERVKVSVNLLNIFIYTYIYIIYISIYICFDGHFWTKSTSTSQQLQNWHLHLWLFRIFIYWKMIFAFSIMWIWMGVEGYFNRPWPGNSLFL